MILLIDNYDSFTWNLYQYFCELGADVLVKRNDALTLADIDAIKKKKIVILVNSQWIFKTVEIDCGGGDAVRFFSSGESLDSLVYIDKL